MIWGGLCYKHRRIRHGVQPPAAAAAAGQVHGDGRTLTAGLINDTEMCLCVSETPFMNIQ